MFCTHPWLTGQFQDVSDAGLCSPKFSRLLEVIDEIITSRGKAIIFTSFQKSVDLIVGELASRFGIPTDYIDGRVPVPMRQQNVDTFTNHKASAVLVLNPRAAGTGLNITAANHVIHFNPEWNPAVEDQASARSYRRGQTHAVTVHHFFYVSTVEEVINDRMQRKRDLAGAAVVGTDGRQQEVEDILRALRISPVYHNKEQPNEH
jgi:SNF2 family DNA or RNA helicase